MSVARFTFDDLLHATSGRVLVPVANSTRPFELVSDSRAIPPQGWFLPLSGERFDGHDYLAVAAQAGAAGAFIAESRIALATGLPPTFGLIAVADPLSAYLALAGDYRNRLGTGLTTLALTGSSGKTTVKEMLAHTLGPLMPTQATAKNFNNEIGVCQTLLATTPQTRLLIVEMGMRGLGQIRPLTRAVSPDIALVLNIGTAHLGLLGSREAIAQAKCEIFEGLAPEGLAVIHGDDPLLAEAARRVWPGRLETFSLSEAQHITPMAHGGVVFTYRGYRFALAESGTHRILNALAVLKIGEALGVAPETLAPALETFRSPQGRGEQSALVGLDDVWLVNDAYNANPDSMRASLAAYLQTAQHDTRRHVLVLGAMKELGAQAEALHHALGVWLAGYEGIDLLVCVGQEAAWLAQGAQDARASFPVVHLPPEPPAPEALRAVLIDHHIALHHLSLFLKGSRACQLETLIAALSPVPHALPQEPARP